MENYKFSTLPYQRPDLEARRTQLARWQDAVEQAKSFDALRALLFEMDRANGELSTQCAIAHIRHTLDTRDAFYEAEIHYLQDTLPTLGAAEVALSEAIASSPFRPDIEREFGRQYFVLFTLFTHRSVLIIPGRTTLERMFHLPQSTASDLDIPIIALLEEQ